MDAAQPSRCMRCEAPIRFQPGAGSRLCPFCDAVNLVREQRIAAPPLELKIDEVFRKYQSGRLKEALADAERLTKTVEDNFRLALYRACLLADMDRSEDAIYALIDLTGMDAPANLRSDAQAALAKSLLAAGRIEEAVQAGRRSLELLDGNPSASLVLAEGLLQRKELEEALKITEETIQRLDRQWKISMPPPAYQLQLLLAEILEAMDRPEESAAAIEDMLLNNTSAPLPAVRTAGLLLSKYYMEHGLDKSSTIELLRQAALLDPENRTGLLDALKKTVERIGRDFREEIEAFKQSREELLSEIRSVLIHGQQGRKLKPEQISPDLDLTLLDPDPDRRTDMLEQAAVRMQLRRFDRGTLYPLKTIEDFRKWVAAWRLRAATERMRRAQNEQIRLSQLKQTMDGGGSRAARRKARAGYKPQRRHRWLVRFLILMVILLTASGVFIALAGDRFLDQFSGNLVKVECIDDSGSPPCILHVATGEQGRKRYRTRQLKRNWLVQWLDSRVHADGTITYPLRFPWGDLDAAGYRRCVGRPVEKMRFTLSPLCNPG